MTEARWRVAGLGQGGSSLVQEAGLGSGAAGALEDFDPGPVTVSLPFVKSSFSLPSKTKHSLRLQ